MTGQTNQFACVQVGGGRAELWGKSYEFLCINQSASSRRPDDESTNESSEKRSEVVQLWLDWGVVPCV